MFKLDRFMRWLSLLTLEKEKYKNLEEGGGWGESIPNVNTHDLWSFQNFSKRPHQCSIYSHQLKKKKKKPTLTSDNRDQHEGG